MKPLFFSILFALLLPTGFAHSQQQRVFVLGSHNTINLCSVDLANCTRHVIDTLPLGMGTIACTPNGKLWAMSNEDSLGGGLYQVDTSTGTLTFAGYFDEHYYYVQSMCALNDSVLLIQCDSDLYGVTTTNVHSFRIGTVGDYNSGDMTWLGQDLYIIGFGGASGGNPNSMYLIKVTFNNGSYPPIASAAPVSNTPSLPNCYGLATYILPNMDTALIGFADSNAYIINPSNGSYTLYCDILPDSLYASDAASISYPSVPIIIDTAAPTGVVSPSNNSTMVNIYPNPTTDKLFVKCPYAQATCVFTDIAGNVILHQGLKKGINEISIKPFASGLYFASIQMEGNIIYRQKIRKK